MLVKLRQSTAGNGGPNPRSPGHKAARGASPRQPPRRCTQQSPGGLARCGPPARPSPTGRRPPVSGKDGRRWFCAEQGAVSWQGLSSPLWQLGLLTTPANQTTQGTTQREDPRAEPPHLQDVAVCVGAPLDGARMLPPGCRGAVQSRSAAVRVGQHVCYHAAAHLGHAGGEGGADAPLLLVSQAERDGNCVELSTWAGGGGGWRGDQRPMEFRRRHAGLAGAVGRRRARCLRGRSRPRASAACGCGGARARRRR